MKIPVWLKVTAGTISAAFIAFIAIFIKDKENKINSAKENIGAAEKEKKEIFTSIGSIDAKIESIKKETEENKEAIKKAEEARKEAEKVSTKAELIIAVNIGKLEKLRKELEEKRKELEERRKALNENKTS
jgi:peptidoglycan hydrolase CwlO-like protein